MPLPLNRPQDIARIHRVISGGQTGVDRAALDAAIELGIEHGGACPKGRLAEDGLIPSRYALHELDSADYIHRTRRNVLESDGTLILYDGELQGGSFTTFRFCQQMSKPVMLVQLRHPGPDKRVARWLIQHRIAVLNVAGPRASKRPEIYTAARNYLLRILGGMGSHQSSSVSISMTHEIK
jgi:hypothetical protein